MHFSIEIENESQSVPKKMMAFFYISQVRMCCTKEMAVKKIIEVDVTRNKLNCTKLRVEHKTAHKMGKRRAISWQISISNADFWIVCRFFYFIGGGEFLLFFPIRPTFAAIPLEMHHRRRFNNQSDGELVEVNDHLYKITVQNDCFIIGKAGNGMLCSTTRLP